MTHRRLYIKKTDDKTDYDLWLETEGHLTGTPSINIYTDFHGGKELILNMSVSTASRLRAALDELIRKCTEPFEDYVLEDEAE